jgi:hypothetical protein
MPNTSGIEYAPVFSCSSVCPIARGSPAAMPAKMSSEMPLPRPALGDLLAEPHQEHRAGDERDRAHHAERESRRDHEARLRLERDRDAERLEEREAERGVARVLRDLSPARLALLLQRLERRDYHRAELHDDRRRDVRHDAEREDREALQRAAGEHVEQAEDPAFLLLEELVEHRTR